MKPRFLFLLLIHLCCIRAASQGLNFINLTTDNGLPSNECYRIVQDKKGYIWVSTESGLVRYNAKDFVLFGKERGMPSTNDIYALDADAKGRVWFATGGWDVGYIEDDSVHVLPKIALFNSSLKASDIIYKIKFNEEENALYVSTHYQTVVVSLSANNTISYKSPASLDSAYNYVLIKENGFVGQLFNSSLSLKSMVYNKLFEAIIPIVFEHKEASLPLKLKRGFFFEFFSNKLSNTEVVLGVSYQVFLYSLITKSSESILEVNKFIQSLHVDEQKNVWVGLKKGGLIKLEKGNNFKTKHTYLNNLSVSDIIEDKEGGIWATTLEKGIFYIANTKIATEDYISDKNEVSCFIKTVDNKLFFSNSKKVLQILNKGSVYNIKLPYTEEAIILKDVINISKGYFLTTSIYSYFLEKKTFSVTPIYQKDIHTDKKLIAPRQGFFNDFNGICYGYNNTYITRFNNSKVMDLNLNLGIKIKFARDITPQKTLICSKESMFIYEKAKNKLTKIESTKNASIQSFFIDSKQNIWLLGINDTIQIVDTNFNIKAIVRLPQKKVITRHVLQQGSSDFWISTSTGLVLVHFIDDAYNKYSLQVFDNTSGFPSSNFYNVELYNNLFYANTSKGVCSFVAKEDLLHKSPPETQLASVKVNDAKINVINSQELELPHTQNNISFQVDALTFKRIGQRGFFYKYKLEGWDSDFKNATGNTVSYSNLPPGNYTFIAKAYYDDNTIDTTPAIFTFTIQPAFWQTWWGISLIGLLIILLVLGFIQWRIKKIQQKEKEKAAINQTIAEYRFTALKAQMNPHFVFNSINVIQNLILEKDKTEAYNSLSKFSKLIRMILNQSDSVFATIEEELTLIKVYVELNQLRVDYPFTFNTNIDSEALYCSIPSLIIQPFVENALWHGIIPLKGKKEGVINLNISLKEENILHITIEDNGVGREATQKSKPDFTHNSKGIELIKERLKAYQVINNHCLAQLDIFDVTENGIPTGTRVELKIATLQHEL